MKTAADDLEHGFLADSKLLEDVESYPGKVEYVTIEGSRHKSLKEYRADIIERVYAMRCESGWIGMDSTLCELMDDYSTALRKMDREGK